MHKQKRSKVAIVYRYVPEYREEFYRLLRPVLCDRGVDLTLHYGTPSAAEAKKGHAREIEWGHGHKNTYITLGSKQIVWQPVFFRTWDADLVIVEQASKLLVNYALWARSKLGRQKLAFWGHGKDFQTSSPNSYSEKAKTWLSKRIDWWFAYNDLSARIVQQFGYPAERVTSVQNTINTARLIRYSASVTDQDVRALKVRLGIESDNIGLYAGGMYEEKRLPFLLQACLLLRQRVPDFHMIFIGSGVHGDLVKDFADTHKWAHFIGPKFDLEKVAYFKMAKVFLMPGLVGLAVLDCFALGTPLITTALPSHSPEISYLENGVNGIIIPQADDVGAYADAVVELLVDEKERQRLCLNGLAASGNYTIERMVQNFADGVIGALRFGSRL